MHPLRKLRESGKPTPAQVSELTGRFRSGRLRKGCSVQFGMKITTAAPGSAQGLYLIVSDIEAARKDLVARSVEVSEVFETSTAASLDCAAGSCWHHISVGSLML